MIRGIDVVYLHSPHRGLGAWYADALGLRPAYGDEHWQEFETEEGCRFAIDYTSFPRSVA